MLIIPGDVGNTEKEKGCVQKYEYLHSVLLKNFGIYCFLVALSLASCMLFWCVISFYQLHTINKVYNLKREIPHLNDIKTCVLFI